MTAMAVVMMVFGLGDYLGWSGFLHQEGDEAQLAFVLFMRQS